MIWGVVVGAAIVLAVAGVAKLAKPAVIADAIRAAGFDVSDTAAAGLGGAELVLGVAVAVWQLPVLALVLGLFYLGFTVFSARLLAVKGPAASCGCFGQRSAPIGVEHIVINVLVAATAFAAAAGTGDGSTNTIAAIGATGALFVLLALVPTLRTADP